MTPTPEQIRALVKTGCELTLVHQRFLVAERAYWDAQRELDRARDANADAAEAVWLRVTIADKVAALSEAWPLYNTIWEAFEGCDQ